MIFEIEYLVLFNSMLMLVVGGIFISLFFYFDSKKKFKENKNIGIESGACVISDNFLEIYFKLIVSSIVIAVLSLYLYDQFLTFMINSADLT